MKIKVSIRDYNFYGQPSCSLRNDSKIEWDRVGVGDVVFFTDMCLSHVAHNRYKKCFKIAWLLEPEAISKQPYNFVFEKRNDFDLVITHHDWFKQKLNNAGYENVELYVNGMTAIDFKDWSIYPKDKLISTIASEKNITVGHQLRHQVISASSGKVDLYGRAYNPIEYKLTGLKDYKFHLAIENSSVNLYITEKVIDCFATGAVPIYWGASAILQMFNPDGIIYAKNKDELIEAVASSHKFGDLLYQEPRVQMAIKDNMEVAKRWAIPENWILDHILIPRGLV